MRSSQEQQVQELSLITVVMLNHCLSLGPWFFSRWILNSNHSERGNDKIIIHGSVSKFQGQVSVFTPESACYSCIFPNNPNDNAMNENLENKIFGPVTSIIGTIQAIECEKIILGIGEVMANKLLCYNSLNQSFNKIIIKKDKNCPICSKQEEK